MEKTTPEEVYERVERGMAWLDEHCPNWVDEINLSRLDLGDGNQCVLGQTAECLLPDYKVTTPHECSCGLCGKPDYMAVVDAFADLESEGPDAYGFDTWVDWAEPYETRTTYEMLTIAWKEKIQERLSARQPV